MTIEFHQCDLPEHVDQSAKPEAVAAAASLNTNLRLQPAIAIFIAGVGFLHPFSSTKARIRTLRLQHH